jgi:CRISPR-associated protein Cmr3
MTSMTDIKTFLVRLTPLERFFFGTEQGETADYYLKGNNFPQQTALLGLIRHQLLIQNNLLDERQAIRDKQKAVLLIGSQSFQFDSANDFGAIIALTPCFINDNANRMYYPSAPEFTLNIKKAGSQFVFNSYDPKNDYPLILKAEGTVTKTEENIFTVDERTGIDKPYFKAIKDKSYFKQVWTKIKPGFSFAFFLTIDAGAYLKKYPGELKMSEALVFFGKEAMPFNMQIEEKSTILPANADSSNAVVCLSDTFLKEDILRFCSLAVTDTVPFRNIVNKTAQNSSEFFTKRPKETNKVRLQLLKKGSVLFAANEIDKVCTAIDTNNNFKKIGYNYYQKIKINILP